VTVAALIEQLHHWGLGKPTQKLENQLTQIFTKQSSSQQKIVGSNRRKIFLTLIRQMKLFQYFIYLLANYIC